ncbi:TIGR03086 family metal-binding protein [Nocardioides sp. GCM10027113]|uniref:TIGR03086 family metal-binding protein n=1 Tax=unclassified Nocardioides TaxID=2615069 RepID=UPI00361A8D63
MTYTKSVLLPVSPDEAFALITEPERLRRWQTVTARIDLRAGGEYRWTVTPGHVAAGTVVEVEPGRRVVLGWGWEGHPELAAEGSTVTFTVEPVEGGTRVTLEHAGLTDEQAVHHAEGWEHFVARLEKAATTGDAGPDEWAAMPQAIDELSSAEATLAVLQPVLRGLTAEDRSRQTPCAEYDGHALAEHLTRSIVGIGSLAGAKVVTPEEGSLEHRISTMAGQAIEAWTHRGLEGGTEGESGLTAREAVGILSLEFLIHAWDFAQTSGQQVTVSEELAGYVLGIGEQLIPGGRSGGSFAEPVAVPAGAGALDRLVALSGRQVPVAA